MKDQVKSQPLIVKIMDATVHHDEDGIALKVSADDRGEILRMEIRVEDDNYDTQQRGQAALNYLLAEVGVFHRGGAEDLVDKRIHRREWDRVASLAAPRATTVRVEPYRTPPVPPLSQEPKDGRFVYVISCHDVEEPLCKIGIANSPERRLRQLSTSSPHALRLELTRYADNARAVEAAAHSHFSAERRNGEWFAVPALSAITFINSEVARRSAA